jgi:hypothetical protein
VGGRADRRFPFGQNRTKCRPKEIEKLPTGTASSHARITETHRNENGLEVSSRLEHRVPYRLVDAGIHAKQRDEQLCFCFVFFPLEISDSTISLLFLPLTRYKQPLRPASDTSVPAAKEGSPAPKTPATGAFPGETPVAGEGNPVAAQTTIEAPAGFSPPANHTHHGRDVPGADEEESVPSAGGPCCRHGVEEEDRQSHRGAGGGRTTLCETPAEDKPADRRFGRPTFTGHGTRKQQQQHQQAL